MMRALLDINVLLALLDALALAHGGRFVTFDRSIPLSAAPGATPEHLVVV